MKLRHIFFINFITLCNIIGAQTVDTLAFNPKGDMSYAFDAVATPDGGAVVYCVNQTYCNGDSNSKDVIRADKLYKFDGNCKITDSVTLPGEGYQTLRHHSRGCMMAVQKNYRYGTGSWLRTTYVSDDMEIIGSDSTEVISDGKMSYLRLFADGDSLIIAGWISDDTMMHIARFDTEWNLKASATARLHTDEFGISVTDAPFFSYNDSLPGGYGFVYNELWPTSYPEYCTEVRKVCVFTHDLECHGLPLNLWYADKLVHSQRPETIEPVGDGTFLVTHYGAATGSTYAMVAITDARLKPLRKRHIYCTDLHYTNIGNKIQRLLEKKSSCVTASGDIFLFFNADYNTFGAPIVTVCLNKNLDIKWKHYTFVNPPKHTFCGDACLLSDDGAFAFVSTLTNYNMVIAIMAHDGMPSDVEDNIQILPFCCYPNPASTSVTLDISPDVKDLVNAVSVYDIAGRTVKTQTAGFESVDISGLAPGIYVMKVTLADGRAFEEKIVKE